MPSEQIFQRKPPPLDPEAPVFPNPPKGETGLSKQPEFMDRLKQYFWSRLTGMEPGQDISYGMIPVTPGGLQGPNRGISEAARQTFKLAGKHPASQGGVNLPYGRPQFSAHEFRYGYLPNYSIIGKMALGEPEAYMSPLSDMDMVNLTRQMGSLTPSAEGQLAERLSLTPNQPAEHTGELYNLLGQILGPIFRAKP